MTSPAVVTTGAALRPVTPIGILGAQLDRLAALLAPGPVDPEVVAVLETCRALAGGLDGYLERCTTPPSAALERLAVLTRSADWSHPSGAGAGPALEAEMLSGHVEGALLQTLVHASRARRVLEIGMFTGYSALAMAEALPHDGEVVACELDAGAAEFAERAFAESAHGRKISVRVGPAAASLAALSAQGQVFDLVFVDADKPGYLGYLDAVLDGGLLAPHGLVCVDNTLMQGQPWLPGEPSPNGAAIADFNTAVAADRRVAQVLLPLRDGLTLIRRVDVDQAPTTDPTSAPGGQQ